MAKWLALIFVVAAGVAACDQQPASTKAGGVDAGGPTVTVTLPAADPQAGRQAFLDLKCTTCHRVPSEPDFPAPVSANPGPPIDAHLAGRDVSYLLTAIASPSHEISPDTSAEVRAHLSGVLSPMGDFSRVMTVRQLVDLQAYVRLAK
jgi:hypothetical protein